MFIEPTVIKTKQGRNVILRSVETEDAQAMLDYMLKTCAETRFLMREPDEVKNDVEFEKQFIGNVLESEKSFMIVAEVYGEFAGNCAINPVGLGRRVAHRCMLGIALYKMYWGQGIGRKMIERALELAKDMGYEQCELDVFSNNEKALALYKSLGFEICGETPNAVRYDDLSADSEIHMIKRL